jgi:sec-independent protein translocase protein TatB
MFGLTLEKLFVISILAAVIIGPQRLPLYADKVAKLVSQFKTFLSTTRQRAEAEIGMPLDPKKWEELDLTRYDPRRIVRDALVAPAGAGAAPLATGGPGAVPGEAVEAAVAGRESIADPVSVAELSADPAVVVDPVSVAEPSAATAPEPRRANPSASGRGKLYAVSGSSAHPRRVRLPEPPQPEEGPSDEVTNDEFVEEPSVR